MNGHHLLEFIVDYLRMMSAGNVNAMEMQDLMDEELETHHAESSIAANAIQKRWPTACPRSVSSPR